MSDRILFSVLWLIIMSLITACAVGGLVLMYSGIYHVIARQYESGSALAGSGLILAAACWLLCKHSDDLIDRRA